MKPTTPDQVSSLLEQNKNVIVIYSVEECPPCALIKDTLTAVLESHPGHSFEFFECVVDRNDKKALGKLFLAGINSFPNVLVKRSGALTGDYAGVPEGWTQAQANAFFDDALFGD